MFRKLFFAIKVIAISVGLALLAGIVIGLSYFLSILFSVACVIAVLVFIVAAICSKPKKEKQE